MKIYGNSNCFIWRKTRKVFGDDCALAFDYDVFSYNEHSQISLYLSKDNALVVSFIPGTYEGGFLSVPSQQHFRKVFDDIEKLTGYNIPNLSRREPLCKSVIVYLYKNDTAEWSGRDERI